MNKLNKTDLEKVAKITDRIQGYLLRTEGKLLYGLAKSCPRETVIIEIGSWKGRSTAWLYFGSASGNKAAIYAIDPHTGSPELKRRYGESSSLKEFKDNIKQIGAFDLVVPVVKKSEEAAKKFDRKVGLIFIDGNHSYRAVKKDFELWFPKLANGGMIVFHDTVEYQNINKVVREKVFKSEKIKNIKIIDSIVCGQKCKKLSITNRFKNRYVLLLHDFCVFASRSKAPYSLIKFGKIILNKIH